ncbi:MAG: ABC-2 transporter permease [Oscillospiraceae bacterium]
MKIRGLLLKDIFELSAQCRVQLVLTGVYLLLPLFIRGIELFASVGMMLLAMMPVYALGYDERCRWERYALAMPVRKSDLFWSRFLLGVIAVALGAAVQVLVALLAGRGDLLFSLAVTAPAAILYLLIVLPLMMKLGVEKGRFLLLLLTAAFMLLSGLIA